MTWKKRVFLFRKAFFNVLSSTSYWLRALWLPENKKIVIQLRNHAHEVRIACSLLRKGTSTVRSSVISYQRGHLDLQTSSGPWVFIYIKLETLYELLWKHFSFLLSSFKAMLCLTETLLLFPSIYQASQLLKPYTFDMGLVSIKYKNLYWTYLAVRCNKKTLWSRDVKICDVIKRVARVSSERRRSKQME